MPVAASKDDLSIFAGFSHEIYLYVPATQLLVFQVFDNMTRKLRVEKFGRNDWEKKEKKTRTHTHMIFICLHSTRAHDGQNLCTQRFQTCVIAHFGKGHRQLRCKVKKYMNVRVIAINQNIFCAVSIPAYPVPGCLANARMHKVSCPTFVVHGPTHRNRPGCQNASRRMSRMYTGVGPCWPMTRHVPLLLDPSRIPDATLGWSVCRIQFSALNSLEWISHDVTKSDAGCGCHLVNGYLHLSL